MFSESKNMKSIFYDRARQGAPQSGKMGSYGLDTSVALLRRLARRSCIKQNVFKLWILYFMININ